jgi:predicted regulator of Ras-like GTPase activity (Roadblock/LC7/MglB family)
VNPTRRDMLTAPQLADYAAELTEIPGVEAAAVLSTDGLLMASAKMERDHADRLAAIASGLTQLAMGGSVLFDLNATTHVLVAYYSGNLLVSAVNDRCVLAVVTSTGATLANVFYEMGLFAEQHGDAISPSLRPPVPASARP